ncbi:hypothetical protein GCM10022225_07640 [Plantactinospora mayteni]|uniref:Aminotransferase class I/classII large domain-containing protein n=1 Tax=Plantactinospora mayteni TaxID=566021 RepID=A0ABQ4EIP5_9ACTN|nr:pyridoxal phosphate-dependent aminotransferase [Plantactinospora mayteni]GIG94490.1 hypothetical protein Pma05_10630 [Plantactinospora mayteni]
MQLFDSAIPIRKRGVPAETRELASRTPRRENLLHDFTPDVDHRVLDVYARAVDPTDPFELRDLWLGRVEHEIGADSFRPALAERWRASRPRRTVAADDVLSSRATARFVKELFNWFFQDDVYGDLRGEAGLILSGGSVDEQIWGLPETLKQCVQLALDRDWYGYSDSRGRVPAREAVAAFENARMRVPSYDTANVAIALGGTFAISTLADFVLLSQPTTGSPALCGIPNYPPLVESIARRRNVRLVPLPSRNGRVSVDQLIARLEPSTPLVMLQTAANPSGAAVAEADLERLVRAASPSTIILLDECHEWLGATEPFSPLRAASNVVRVSSLSKTWSAPGLKIGWILADSRVIDAYYEYASTTFGGPPSFFYTLVEVLARMERWLHTGLVVPGWAEVAEFEHTYGLDADRLRMAYDAYRHDRINREQELTVLRAAAVTGFSESSALVVPPKYSINLALRFEEWDDSYRCFRDLLRRTGVSTFPGILTFCFSGGVVRVTTARRWADISSAMSRFRNAPMLLR